VVVGGLLAVPSEGGHKARGTAELSFWGICAGNEAVPSSQQRGTLDTLESEQCIQGPHLTRTTCAPWSRLRRVWYTGRAGSGAPAGSWVPGGVSK
jgi:hypothetical protein